MIGWHHLSGRRLTPTAAWRELYRLVEEGISELDDALKERVAALKAGQQAARDALARLKSDGRATIRLGPSIIEEFGVRMREQVTSGEVQFRKAYLRVMVDRIDVDDREVRISGRKDVLEQAIIACERAEPRFAVLYRSGWGTRIRT